MVSAPPVPLPGGPLGRDRRTLWLGLALAAAVLLIYEPTIRHGFLSYDDLQYVTENPTVKAGLTWHGIRWAATTGYFAYWHPLTWLSLMLDAQIYGMNAGGFHLTNLLLHLASTLLLFLALREATGSPGRSALVAALFAAHPLHVETVAWVAERKGVLSSFFLMLALRSYFRYAREPRLGRYLPVAFWFAAGLMSKPMVVTLPCLLLLLDYWPLGRFSLTRASLRSAGPRLLLEKTPLFVLAAASSLVTLHVVRQLGVLIEGAAFPLGLRLVFAVITYVAYIGSTLWPARLAAFYPFPTVISGWWVVVCGLTLFALSLAVLREANRRPYLPVGWFWYLGTMFPVIGLVQTQGLTIADRYTYVPIVGLFIMAAWGIPELVPRWRPCAAALPGVAVAVTLACVVAARRQVGHWADDTTLWTHALSTSNESEVAHNNLGLPAINAGRFAEASHHFAEALRLKPDYPEAHMNLGNALAAEGRLDAAVAKYRDALRVAPSYAMAHANLAVALARLGKAEEALSHFSLALAREPGSTVFRYNFAGLLLQLGRHAEARDHLTAALRLDPQNHDARKLLAFVNRPLSSSDARRGKTSFRSPLSPVALTELGGALLRQGKSDEAAARFSEAVQLQSDFATAHVGLGLALIGQGKTAAGITQLRRAVRLAPDDPVALVNLGIALASQGHAKEAVILLSKGVRLAPDMADGHFNLAVLLATEGKLDQSIHHLEAVLRVEPQRLEARTLLEELMQRSRTGRE